MLLFGRRRIRFCYHPRNWESIVALRPTGLGCTFAYHGDFVCSFDAIWYWQRSSNPCRSLKTLSLGGYLWTVLMSMRNWRFCTFTSWLGKTRSRHSQSLNQTICVHWKQINHFSRLSHTLPCVYIHCNSARKTLFPDAKPFEARSKAAIVSVNPPLGAPTKSHRSVVHAVNRTIDNDLNGLTSMDGSHRVSHFAVDAPLSSDSHHSQRRFSAR